MIVPTRDPARRLPPLVASLAGQTREFELVVVDNGSGADLDAVLDGIERARVLRLGENAGFSRAVNLGVAAADGDALVLVNDDCTCEPGFVAALADALDPAASVVMAASVLRDAARPELIDTAGMELDPTLLVFDYLNGTPLAGLGPGVPAPVGPSAAAAAFDRGAFEAVGGFDERLFAYWEDVDLVLRLRGEGGRSALAASAVGTHHHSATLGSGSPEKNFLMGYGRGYVLRKWGVLGLRRALSVAARETVICAGQLAVDRNAAGVRGRVRGLRDARREHRYPGELIEGHGYAALGQNLRRRWSRRARLRDRGAAVGA